MNIPETYYLTDRLEKMVADAQSEKARYDEAALGANVSDSPYAQSMSRNAAVEAGRILGLRDALKLLDDLS